MTMTEKIKILYCSFCKLVGVGKKIKSCLKCKSAIPRNARVCRFCGHLYEKGINMEELTGLIEDERDQQSSDEIDYNFEKMEEITVDELVGFDGEIEEYLKQKGEGCKN